MLNPGRILVLAPHTDDGELGCGGTLAKYAAAGAEIFYAAFSDCRKSLPGHVPPDTLRNECKQATALLGIPTSHLVFFDYEVRTFPAHRQSILEEMVKLNKSLQPELVFIPAATDIHQDHGIIHAESLRAFKYCSVLGYELPWNTQRFSTDCFIRLDEEHVQQKLRSLKAYTSQSGRNYFSKEFINSLAIVRGVQCGAVYAEAFEVCRLIKN
jgi:LmbE family N-acetylglucosaminyl deacetylase